MDDIDIILDVLQQSEFRSKFYLKAKMYQYLKGKGLETIMAHGRDFIEKRLTPAFPKNDGRQTPMDNHPVFVAQHATATCCRGCLEQWHHIPRGRKLSGGEQQYILAVIKRWIEREIETNE